MFECFCCKQVGYMQATFKFFPKRDNPSEHHAICMMCVPYVEKSIKEYESKQTKLDQF
jgi:hypothetical protein